MFVQEAHSSFTFLRVPKVFQHLSRKRVLTMEWMAGESPTDLLSLSSGSSVDYGSAYSERKRFDARRRLLDFVCDNDNHTILVNLGLLIIYDSFCNSFTSHEYRPINGLGVYWLELASFNNKNNRVFVT